MADAWSPFYWGDYLRKTSHLSLAEHGAYILLMEHYYSSGCPINANPSVLHRVCRCADDTERAACDSVVLQFFTKDGDLYRHDRIDEEISKSNKIKDKGRDAANKRWHGNANPSVQGNAKPNANPSAGHMPAACQSQSQSQSHKNPETGIDGSLAFEGSMLLYPAGKRDFSVYSQNKYFEAVGEIRQTFGCSDVESVKRLDKHIKSYVASKGEFCLKFTNFLDSKPWKGAAPSKPKFIPRETDEQLEARLKVENQARRDARKAKA